MSLWSVYKRFSDLATRIERVELEMKVFRLDHDEMYERYRKLASRVAKDRRTIEAHEQSEGEAGAVDSLSGINHGAGLTDRQKQIQQIVLKRRAGAA